MGNAFHAVIASLALLAVSACGGSEHDMSQHTGALAAPSQLGATVVAGGVHLTWRDNSVGEDQFMVVRKEAASDWVAVGSTTADATAFHDTTVVPGTTYTYVVHAMRASVTSAPSNMVVIALP